jgi:hypothetical protein
MTDAGPHQPPSSSAESQTARKARLFGIIRDDAARGMSIRQIAGRRHVHRRMVRQALAEPAGPPPRKRGSQPAPAIGPIQNVLDALAGKPLTIWEIWTTVTDDHDSDASYAAIRDYIRSRSRPVSVSSARQRAGSTDVWSHLNLIAAGSSGCAPGRVRLRPGRNRDTPRWSLRE